MPYSPAPPLTARQMEILMAVVQEHIATKEAVGSGQLRARYGFSVSSATIRNEMAYLEEAAYLHQPHTSAGRVPMPRAFRIYVNRVEHEPAPGHAVAVRVYDSECRRLKGRPRALLRATSRSLAALAGYPAIVMSPSNIRECFADIKVSPVSSNNVLLTYETDTGKRVQHLLRSPDPLTAEQIAKLSRALQKIYRGRAIGELAAVTSTDLAAAVDDCQLPEALLQSLRQAVETEEDREIYLDGTSYLLDEPQFQRLDSLRRLIETLDQRALLREALLACADSDQVTVTIGEENRVPGMDGCSLVARSYPRAGFQSGSVAVLGPLCMDYRSTMSAVSQVAQCLSEAVGES
jgi:heat-inducible transcriptional repressor